MASSARTVSSRPRLHLLGASWPYERVYEIDGTNICVSCGQFESWKLHTHSRGGVTWEWMECYGIADQMFPTRSAALRAYEAAAAVEPPPAPPPLPKLRRVAAGHHCHGDVQIRRADPGHPWVVSWPDGKKIEAETLFLAAKLIRIRKIARTLDVDDCPREFKHLR